MKKQNVTPSSVSLDSFACEAQLSLGNASYTYYDLGKLSDRFDLSHLPFSLKILLENMLRKEDGKNITKTDIEAVCRWRPDDKPHVQIDFTPARVVLQDFTGVPAIVDLAAMRDAIVQLGGDAERINPLESVDLVIDHSVMVDYFASDDALAKNTSKEFERNNERYRFLRWGQTAFSNFRVVPPGTGIVHQVNLEYLARVVMTKTIADKTYVYPDTLVGTDSHTTMINGLGVLGWGVGGIEAEAAMLGQPVSMLLPEVVGVKLDGAMPEGATATDLVLMVVEMLRKKGVVGKFVEFYGDGLSNLPLADRATIANMAPEYGATCGMFPIDRQTLDYLQLSGRDSGQIQLVEAYAKRQGLWREEGDDPASYSDYLALDLADVVPSLAGPKRPQDRIPLARAKQAFVDHLQLQAMDADVERFADEGGHSAVGVEQTNKGVSFSIDRETHWLNHGDVVIAAITSCTNTSNPAVMLAAGLVAKRAHEKGLKAKPWIKTSLAPGSQVVSAYLENAGLMEPLKALGFAIVGYGCTTCIGNSGPLPEPVSQAIHDGDLTVCSVLSGNRNFEGRIHPEVGANYLASPPLVVIYALAGSMLIDVYNDPLGQDADGKDVYMRDLWPSQGEINQLIAETISAPLYEERYADVFKGTDQWRALPTPEGKTYNWPTSTYINKPPYFVDLSAQVPPLPVIEGALCLVKVGDSITTDHISPAGAIHPDSPAGQYLRQQGVEPKDFNSLGARRGNHEVMMRGTFANTRLRNQLAPGTEGGYTRYLPSGETLSIFDAAMRYREARTPLIVLAGKEYGTGSSRDWAAKGTKLLGIEAVIAESFERIHRSNLVGFGVLPLQYTQGQNAQSLGLTGEEFFNIDGLENAPDSIVVTALRDGNVVAEFEVQVRIDTPSEWDYYQHGGILHFVLRSLA